MAARALVREHRRDVAREARRERRPPPSPPWQAASAATASASAGDDERDERAASTRAAASYVPHVSRSTPQISPTVQCARSASRSGGRRFASLVGGARARRRGAARAASAIALGPHARRPLALAALALGIDLEELDAPVLVLGEAVHADDDALARLDLGLVAERRSLDLALDEALPRSPRPRLPARRCARSAPARAPRARPSAPR